MIVRGVAIVVTYAMVSILGVLIAIALRPLGLSLFVLLACLIVALIAEYILNDISHKEYSGKTKE